MTPILAAAFWLVVTVHGEVKERSGPLTAQECANQMAFRILYAQRLAAEYGHVVIDGRKVTLGDVTIECKPGERGT